MEAEHGPLCQLLWVVKGPIWGSACKIGEGSLELRAEP